MIDTLSRSRSFIKFGKFLGLLTLNSNVNKLLEFSNLSKNLIMGVYGMVFWGGESIFEVKIQKFLFLDTIPILTLTIIQFF